MFRKLAVQITERSVVNVYTDITCSIDDRLVIETKGGLVMAYIRVDKLEDAKAWARALVKHLIKMELITKDDLERLK